MKFVFFGYDHSLDVAQRLMADGHVPMAVFTFPCDNNFAFNVQIHHFAKSCGIPIFEEPISAQDIEALTREGCEVFLACGYPYKIPPIDFSRACGLNLHPALLPRVRGIMPTPYIIMHEPEAAGLTLHKLSPRFDAGDILAQLPLPIDENTDVEVLSARLGLHSPDLIAYVFQNLRNFWQNAVPQEETKASFYPLPREDIRTLDWTETAYNLNKKGRAFGRYGCVASIQNNEGESQKFVVFQSSAWQETHNYKAGTLLRSSPREILIAIGDGYICLKEFQILASDN